MTSHILPLRLSRLCLYLQREKEILSPWTTARITIGNKSC